MNIKPVLWMLAGGTIAFLLVIAYWMFALTLADHMKSYLVPQNKAASYVHALIDADRTPIPNASSTHSTRPALPASSNTGETKLAFLCLHSFSWSQNALSLKRISSSRSGSQA
jgi:hypothetical protein